MLPVASLHRFSPLSTTRTSRNQKGRGLSGNYKLQTKEVTYGHSCYRMGKKGDAACECFKVDRDRDGWPGEVFMFTINLHSCTHRAGFLIYKTDKDVAMLKNEISKQLLTTSFEKLEASLAKKNNMYTTSFYNQSISENSQ